MKMKNSFVKKEKKNRPLVLLCAVMLAIGLGAMAGCSAKETEENMHSETSAPAEGEEKAVTPEPEEEEAVTPEPEEEEAVTPAPEEEEAVTPTPEEEEAVTPAPEEEEAAAPTPTEEETEEEIPELVWEKAEEYVTELYSYDWANIEEYDYIDWRITSLEHCYTYEDFEGMVLQVYRLDFQFLSDHPENVELVGGMSITEDGWVTIDYANSRFLIFRQEGETRSYLKIMCENDCSPGDETFTNDLKNRLENTNALE